MTLRAAELIEQFKMERHPEGGYYRETYRSEELLDTPNGPRNYSTCIYFLLPSDEVSKFHRINSDELWFFHEGSPLVVELLTREGQTSFKLGIQHNCKPQAVVPKETIFGARVMLPDHYSLVSCVVSPGFDFKDFELMNRQKLLEDFPNHSEIIHKLT